jgi:hypothetical protein
MKLQALLSLAVCALGGVVTNGQIDTVIDTNLEDGTVTVRSCPSDFDACRTYLPDQPEKAELKLCSDAVVQIIRMDSWCGKEWDRFCVSNYNKCYVPCGDEAAMVDIERGPGGGATPVNRTQITCPPTAQPTPRPTPAPIEEAKTDTLSPSTRRPTPAPFEEARKETLAPSLKREETTTEAPVSKGKGGTKGMKGAKGDFGKGKGGEKGGKGVLSTTVGKSGAKGAKAAFQTIVEAGTFGKSGSKSGAKGAKAALSTIVEAGTTSNGGSKSGAKGGKGSLEDVAAASTTGKGGAKGAKAAFSAVSAASETSKGGSKGGAKGGKGAGDAAKSIGGVTKASLEVESWSDSKEVTAQMLSDNALLGTGSISSAPSRSLGVFCLSLLTAVGVTMLSLF